jgi:predicted nucleic acid-binding protein
LANRPGEQLRPAAITVAELHGGLDATMAREYARLRINLMAVGTGIGAHDLQIAVTALVIGYQVATRDLRSFPRIPGLKFEPW